MKSREEIRGLIALLSVCTKQELVRIVVEEGMDNEAYRERENQAGQLLDETRDYVDTLKRRADLIHAISDTVSENALESAQLEAIAAIVWPAVTAGLDLENHPFAATRGPVVTDPTQIPTQIRMSDLDILGLEAMLLTASGLLWNAHHFIRHIESMPGFVMGEMYARHIEQWREKFKVWRHATSVEKHETEEMRRDALEALELAQQ